MIWLQLLTGILFCMILSWISSFLCLFSKPDFSIENMVVRIVIGTLVLASFTAIIVTKGHTIFIMAIPTLILLGFSFKKMKHDSNHNISVKDILAFFIFIMTATTIVFINIRGIDFNGMKVPINDQAWYATIGRAVIDYQNESYIAYLQPYYKYKTFNVPYHYYESWLTYDIVAVMHCNVHLALNGIIFGFGLTTIFITFYLILNLWLQKHYLLMIGCSILFLFIRGIVHYWPAVDENFVHATDSIFFDGNQKLIYVLPYFLLGFYFIFKKEDQMGLLILLTLPAINIVFLPSVLGAIGIFLCYNLIDGKQSLRTFYHQYRYIIIAIFLFIITLIFYLTKIALNSNNLGIVTSIGGIASNIFNNGSKWLLINGIMIIILIFLLIKNQDKVGIKLFILSFGIYASGLLGYAFFDNNQNAWQLYASASRFTGYAFILILLFLIRNKVQWLRNASMLLLVMALLMFMENFSNINHLPMRKISSYSSAYIEKISTYQFKNKMGIKFINSVNRPDLQRNPVYAGLCNYFVLTENAFSTIVLNVDDLMGIESNDSMINLALLKKNQVKGEIIMFSPFLNAVGLSNQMITKRDLENLQIEFINKWKPEFCIVEKDVRIPTYLKVKTCLTDLGTREKFLILSQ